MIYLSVCRFLFILIFKLSSLQATFQAEQDSFVPQNMPLLSNAQRLQIFFQDQDVLSRRHNLQQLFYGVPYQNHLVSYADFLQQPTPSQQVALDYREDPSFFERSIFESSYYKTTQRNRLHLYNIIYKTPSKEETGTQQRDQTYLKELLLTFEALPILPLPCSPLSPQDLSYFDMILLICQRIYHHQDKTLNDDILIFDVLNKIKFLYPSC